MKICGAMFALLVMTATPAAADVTYWYGYASIFKPGCSERHANNFGAYCFCLREYYNTSFNQFCQAFGCGEDYPEDERSAQGRAASNELGSIDADMRAQGCN